MPDDKAKQQQQQEEERKQRQADEDRAREAQSRLRSGTGDEAPEPGSPEERGQRRIGAVPGGATETEQRVQLAATDPLRLSPEARSAEGATEPIMLGDTADGNDPAIALKRATEAPRVVYAAPAEEEVAPAEEPEVRRTRTVQQTQPRDAQQEDTQSVKR